jgi:hypothetical protein
LSAPWVVTPRSVWNIQKKLLLTYNANSAPEPMASASITLGTSRPPMIGARIPAAVMAATETDPVARCRTAAKAQVHRAYHQRDHRVDPDHQDQQHHREHGDHRV